MFPICFPSRKAAAVKSHHTARKAAALKSRHTAQKATALAAATLRESTPWLMGMRTV